ncbi:MAG: diguanylate cyclase [Pigmentiphaga sp.]
MTLWQHRIGKHLNLIVAAICVVTIAGIWLTTVQRVASERAQAVLAAMKSNSNLAIAFEQQVFRTLKAAEQVASFVRDQYLQQGQLDLNQWVEKGVIREAMFTIISVVDETGAIIYSSQDGTSQVNYSDRAFFVAQREANGADVLFVNQPVLGRVSNSWRIPMSLRITRPDGSFGGVVVMSVEPDSFTDFYRHADLGSQGLLELTGLDGVMRAQKIGGANSFGMKADNLSWFQNQKVVPEGGFVDDGRAIDGVARVISYRMLEGYPLMVTVGTAFEEELAPVWQRRTYYLAAAASSSVVLLVFAALLVLMLSRQRKAAQALQSSEALYRATFHQAAMGIAHIAPDGRILRANDKFCSMLGYCQNELFTHSIYDLSDRENHRAARKFLKDRLSKSSLTFSPEIEKPYRRKDGSIVWVCEALGVVKDARGKPDFLVAVVQDITSRKDLEARLSHNALHDALTGLPNRVMFKDRLAQALESARRHNRLTAVLYLDLDGFKDVNDSYGHPAGDELLQQVAMRLKNCVRAEDTVARFGGDEFGIVLAAISAERDGESVANKIIAALAEPYVLERATVRVSASVGGAVYPRHGDDAVALVSHADSAMYAAKHAGKNRFRYEPLPRQVASS